MKDVQPLPFYSLCVFSLISTLKPKAFNSDTSKLNEAGILGFLIGYILGSFYGNRKIIIVLFALGYLLGYYCHHREWIK